MGRRLRYFEPGDLVEVTNRTFQGRLLLRPSPAFNEIFLGVLGWAQSACQLAIHFYAALSNHYHLLCSPLDAEQLSWFECHFNSRLAREVNRLHGWHGKVWHRRYEPILVSPEPAAQIARLRYQLAHGCKEGFVWSPRDWPGVRCVDALLDGRPQQGLLYNRTLEYEANRRYRRRRDVDAHAFASLQTVKLTPLPCWQNLDEIKVRGLVADLVDQIEEETRARVRETGREPLGARFVCRQQPHELPLRSKRSPAPAVHAVSKAVRSALVERYRAFARAYRRAAELLRAGVLTVEFPAGCFRPALPFSRGSPVRAPT